MVKRNISISEEQDTFIRTHMYKLSTIVQHAIKQLMDDHAMREARLREEYPPLVILNKSKGVLQND